MFSLSFFCSQSDQQDHAWYYQEGKQAAHTYCWAGKSSTLFIQAISQTADCMYMLFSSHAVIITGCHVGVLQRVGVELLEDGSGAATGCH